MWIDDAVDAGARKWRACEEAGISVRTYQRWLEQGAVAADRRPTAVRPTPSQALTPEERERILAVCCSPGLGSLPPSQIVPRLADQGVYLGSESSFYRVLKQAAQQHHRGRARQRRSLCGPQTHTARAANQVWAWDITYLPGKVRGQHYYLYLIEDIFSRKGVTWEVHDCENGEYAAELIERGVLRERCLRQPLVLHSDNGAPMKCQTMRAKLAELNITPSHNRPRVSNDNAYAESLFRTLKYCPQWPTNGFASLEAARAWVERFMHWYNHEHRHSGIGFVTPAQRHSGEDIALLKKRDILYRQAQRRHPNRWTGNTRNWQRTEAVTLNPVSENTQRKAA